MEFSIQKWKSRQKGITPVSLSRWPLGICLLVVPTAQKSSQKSSRGSFRIETASPHDRCSPHRRSRLFLGPGCPGATQQHTVGHTFLDRYTAPYLAEAWRPAGQKTSERWGNSKQRNSTTDAPPDCEGSGEWWTARVNRFSPAPLQMFGSSLRSFYRCLRSHSVEGYTTEINSPSDGRFLLCVLLILPPPGLTQSPSVRAYIQNHVAKSQIIVKLWLLITLDSPPQHTATPSVTKLNSIRDSNNRGSRC